MSSIEYEKRFFIDSHQDLINKLTKFGAKFNGYKYLINKIFTKGGKKDSTFIRLRYDGISTFLTLKERIGEYDNEYETKVESIDTMEKILDTLNIKHLYTNEKLRETWIKDNIHFDIDYYPGLEPYLEIETTDEKTLHDTYTKLGLEPDDINVKDLYKEKYNFTLKKSYKYLGFNKFNVDAIKKNKDTFIKVLKFQQKLIKEKNLS